MPVSHSSTHLIAGALFAAALLLAAPHASGQYNSEIARWANQDTQDPVASGSVLFVGSSGIRRWEQVTRDFGDYHVLQRGLGGALIADIDARKNDIILKYQPRAVVMWAGTNDLAAGATAQSVSTHYTSIANAILADQPTVELFYIGIMPTPGRESNRPREDAVNAQIAAFSATNQRLHYIDMPAAFAPLGPYTGTAFTSKFVDDIHLNREGYDLWTSVIRPAVSAAVAPGKTFAPNVNTLKAGERLFFDFGPNDATNGNSTGVDAAGNQWNNWFTVSGAAAILPGEHRANLITTTGRGTGIRMTMTAQFIANGRQNGGLLAPNAALLGDFAVPSATEDYFYSTADNRQGGGDDDTGGGFMLDGLDPSRTYDFRIFGARDATETRITEYKLVGANTVLATLTTSGSGIGANGANTNNNQIALLSGVRPDAFGQVWFDMTLRQGGFAYISAMEITVTPEPASILGLIAVAPCFKRRRS